MVWWFGGLVVLGWKMGMSVGRLGEQLGVGR